MRHRQGLRRAQLLGGAAFVALAIAAGGAAAQERITIAPQSLDTALNELGARTGQQVLIRADVAVGKMTRGVTDSPNFEVALASMLSGTGLGYRREDDTWLIVKADTGPQSGSAAGGGAEVEALIVTAQKREEDIQDVPIAISAFTQEQLERSQVAGGPDLMTQVPNMTFTKTNFTTYSIQLRGIGTQAISATVDHAVAVAFNNTPFIRNRFFEQEFYDLQRIEVLRGPQGTLYGRNATAGVVNLISMKPRLETYEAKLSGDISNYNTTRLEGMLNIPLAEDVAALRIAGAWTKREGYATNEITGNPIDGRDLWSTRTSLRFKPTDRLDVNLIWEHFEENDDRIRSGKQLCKTHTVTSINGIFPGADGTTLDGDVVVLPTYQLQIMPDHGQATSPGTISSAAGANASVQGTLSQGCTAESLYSPDSFQTPNGLSLPYYGALSAIGLPVGLIDPYASRTQSRDLRVIESAVDPRYEAKADVVELQMSYDLTDSLTVTSETGYSSDFIFSTQDYNRFNTAAGAWNPAATSGYWVNTGILDENGVFCDPQIGCSDRLLGVDVSEAQSRQFSQELRLSSSYDGPFNFSLGANFLRYDTEDKYYVFFNSLSIFAATMNGSQTEYVGGVTDNRACLPRGFEEQDPNGEGVLPTCTYIDPNPIGSLNDLGRNYFLSRNPYKLISYAVFGEAYYNLTEALKVTAGLRWTVDKKEAPRIPSWLLAGDTVGLPVAEVVEQEWREPTGRLTVDWKPDLAFTDETLLYASYAHGYKAGGMNPPAAGLVCYAGCGNYVDEWNARSAVKPKTFDAEAVDAFELGAKNTLLDGRVTLNLAAFYYDYEGYQLSQIVDRSAITQNFDATVWGLEIEADWRPLENLKLGFKGGYEQTKVADGMRAIDVMDRTAGTPGWVAVSPFPTFPSNCVLPAFLFIGEWPVGDFTTPVGLGGLSGGGPSGCELAYLFQVDPVTGLEYVPNPTVALDPSALNWRPGYAGWDPTFDYGQNRGEGFFKELGGNELPNAPNFTATITADYTLPLPSDWLLTLHTDLYYQSEAWTRIFNTEGYDKLKAYTNVNLAAIFTQEEQGWKVMAYVKNVFDRDSITGAFLNSDDTGLTTNVFLTEPRLYGLRVTKDFRGGPWWTGANINHEGPYPLTVEVGGQVQRHEADYELLQSSALAELPEPMQTFDGVQKRDLDWGDGRSVRLTYRPNASPWKISAGMRYGRTNNDIAREHAGYAELHHACLFPTTSFLYYFLCNPVSPFYNPAAVNVEVPSFTDTEARSREEHTIIDFEVGYDVGLGAMQRSTFAAGLRYAEFTSSTRAAATARGDWIVEPGFGYNGFDLHQVYVDLAAEREFRGTGPTLSWEAAMSLLGDDQTGRLLLDWRATAGALFGRQETTTTGQDEIGIATGFYDTGGGAFSPLGFPLTPVGEPTAFALPATRSRDATVPVVDLALGVAYEVGRVKLSTGYRWERYFDVLDVGYDEEQSADRTVDGPYFKLAVGFGG
jgi:outer membrane receptor protein involved in Fe transport